VPAVEGGGVGEARIASFLTQLVESNPGLKFGAIVRAAQVSCRVSRATAARQLARLVRFGDLVILPDHTYGPGGSDGDRARAVVEIRWQDMLVTILPSGAGRVFHHREFRVVSGSLEFLDFAFIKRPTQFSWWLSAPGRLNRAPRAVAGAPMFAYRIDLESPLSSRDAAWHRLLVSGEIRDWFRMDRGPEKGPRAPSAAEELGSEFLCTVLPLHARVYDQRVAPEAHLRLQVALPERYPVRAPRPRVTWQTNPDRADATELLRLRAATAAASHQDGLRVSSTTFTLSVPQPRLDRRYCIVWDLPTTAQRRRWLSTQGAHPR
jgi:hypothetical protein